MNSGLPFYDFLTTNRMKLLGNMLFHDSPGHMLQELDNFFRMKHLGELDPRFQYLAVFPSGPTKIPAYLAAALPQVIGRDQGLQILVDDNFFKLACEIQTLRPDLAVDVGVSHFKLWLPDRYSKSHARLMHLPGAVRSLYWVLSHSMHFDCMLEHSRRWANSKSYRPWDSIGPLTPDLINFLGPNHQKIALIHISNRPQNARVATEPESLVPSIEYLTDNGYNVVKIGWEPYPESWSRYGVKNYNASGLMNYGNDLLLLKAASFAMFNGTGSDFLSNFLETPMVNYASWIVPNMRPSRNCVHLFLLMRNKLNGRIMTFAEQAHFLENNYEYWEKGNCTTFPFDRYDPVHPTPELILASVKESTALGTNWTPRSALQQRVVELDQRKYFAYVDSRVSQALLEQHPELLETGITY